MATGRLVSWASCGALAVWFFTGCAGGAAQAPKPAVAPVAKPAEITDVRVSGMGDAVQVTVTASARAAYSLVRHEAPPRLFLQLTGTKLAGLGRIIPVNRGAVTQVKSSAGGPDASVEVFLSAEAIYDVEGRGNEIVLNVSPKPPAPAVAVAETAAAPAPAVVTTIAVEEPAPVAPAVKTVSPMPAEAAVPAGPRVLTAIDVKKQSDGLIVTLQGDGPLKHDYFLVEGRSLVVDIAGASNKVSPMKRKVDDAWVSQIRIGEHEQPKKVRIVFDLKKVAEHRVDTVGNGIVVAFGAPALAAAAPVPAKANQGSLTALNTVGAVSCRAHDAVTRLEIRTAVRPEFTIVDSGDAAKIIVEIANAKISESDTKAIDLAALNLDVVKVSAFPYTKGDAKFVRVVAQLRRPAPFRAVAEDQRILVDFEKSAAPVAAVAAIQAPVPVAVAAPVKATAPVVIAPAPAAGPAPSVPAAPGFTGRRLSLDFKDADVNDILRLISEVSGLNFVAGPEVKGTVSIKLADVPWDQALDLILKTNEPQLAQIRESESIVRITTADKILAEQDRINKIEASKKTTAEAQQALEPLVTKVIALSYTDSMAGLQDKLKNFLSKQGKVDFDERTKSLIIRDTAAAVAEIEKVLKTLDAPTPAVLIEARIVQMDSNAGVDLGVQWGLNFTADQAHGNSTKYAFPNSIGVGGTQGETGNYMVNLPNTNATAGGVGLSFGHIANTLGLDLKLSAMETLGKSKTLSTPKILVLHAKQAIMQVGVDLPQITTTTTTTGTTSSVEWKKVGIMLDVSPSVTNDKHIVMKIKVSKDSQGENVQVNNASYFSINKKEASTEVIVADGETTVIGGLYEELVTDNDNGIPGLMKLPVVGWLFKSQSKSQRRNELMIFVTPRIVTM